MNFTKSIWRTGRQGCGSMAGPSTAGIISPEALEKRQQLGYDRDSGTDRDPGRRLRAGDQEAPDRDSLKPGGSLKDIPGGQRNVAYADRRQ